MGSNAKPEAAAGEEEEEGEEKDFQYQDFLKSLRYQGKSYVVKLVVDGLPTDVKCEGREISDEDCDHDLNKRIPRSARKRSNGLSNGSPSTYLSEEAGNLSRGNSREKVRRETLIPDEIMDEGCGHDLNKRILRCAGKRTNGLPNGSPSTYPSEEAGNLSRGNSRKKVRRETLIPDEIMDEGCGHDLNKRILRSAMKRSNGISNGSPSTYLSEEAENLSRGNSRKNVKTETLIPDEIVDEGCGHDLNKRILRSARKRTNGLSNVSTSTYPSEEAENLSRGNSRKKVRRETLIPDEIVEDPDYAAFLRGCKIVGDQPVYADGHNTNRGESSGQDDECDHDLNKRILRSARKRSNGLSNVSQSTYPSEEAENLSRRNSRKKVRRETLTPDEIVEDPDYAAFLRGCKIVGDQPVYADWHNTNRGESGGEDDEWAPHVEFLDRATFYKKSEFRSQLIGVLRKPYDKEEDENLYEAIDNREPEKRHKDLRHGRDKSCSTDKYGKSYLDHHPDLREQLAQLDGDGPKRLNLLRGFFFWLKKASHGGSFLPWKDEKCLAIIPGSG